MNFKTSDTVDKFKLNSRLSAEINNTLLFFPTVATYYKLIFDKHRNNNHSGIDEDF